MIVIGITKFLADSDDDSVVDVDSALKNLATAIDGWGCVIVFILLIISILRLAAKKNEGDIQAVKKMTNIVVVMGFAEFLLMSGDVLLHYIVGAGNGFLGLF